MRYDIAEAGIFNKDGMTPEEAVGRENLHSVLRYKNVRDIQADERHKAMKSKNK